MSPNEDFSDSRDILDFKPRLELTEPDQVKVPPPPPSDKVPLEEIKAQLDGAIDSYKKIEKLADIAQLKIDARAKGFQVNLDPKADAHVIQALKRAFPDRADHTKISFEDYRHCIDELGQASKAIPPDPSQVTLGPVKTDFGGFGKPDGLNRPELDQNSQIIEPIDLVKFQNDQIKQLFDIMKPLMTDLIKSMLPGPGF